MSEEREIPLCGHEASGCTCFLRVKAYCPSCRAVSEGAVEAGSLVEQSAKNTDVREKPVWTTGHNPVEDWALVRRVVEAAAPGDKEAAMAALDRLAFPRRGVSS